MILRRPLWWARFALQCAGLFFLTYHLSRWLIDAVETSHAFRH